LLTALGTVGVLTLFLGALPAGPVVVEAQAAGAQPSPTPTFVWRVTGENTGHKLSVDPFAQKFEFVPAQTPGASPIPTISALAPNMEFTHQRVTWKYDRPNQLCPTPTPRAGTPTPTPTRRTAGQRCPTFVWGTIDRVRHTVRATYMQRSPNTGTTVRMLTERDIILTLPQAPAPAVTIRDFNVVPRTNIIKPTDRVSFQNDSEWPCSLVFDKDPGPTDLTTGRVLGFDVGRVERARFSTPFPYLAATPTSTTTPSPQQVWTSGTHGYTVTCQGRTFTGTILVRE
jgi:hypothetical protein